MPHPVALNKGVTCAKLRSRQDLKLRRSNCDFAFLLVLVGDEFFTLFKMFRKILLYVAKFSRVIPSVDNRRN